jgi:ABC-2 type transport system permease protein
MTLTWAHAKAATLELLRFPSFSLPTLAFPASLFLVFGLRRREAGPELVMTSYAALAILGVAFFQFGVGMAAERVSPWHTFLRLLPAPTHVRLGARLASAFGFAFASTTLVCAIAVATTSPRLAATEWLVLLLALVVGGIAFSFLGIALGYWLRPRGALPVANLLFLSLSYAGGMWTAPSHLPSVVAEVSPYLPTRIWGELLAGAVDGPRWELDASAGLLAYGLVFALVAGWGYRRDEGERFR